MLLSALNQRLASRYFALAAASAAIACWLAGFWITGAFPVYTDEMGYRLLHSRFLRDGGVNIYLFPHCGAGFFAPVPWWMVPIRLLEEDAYGHQWPLTHLRDIGLAINALVIVVTCWLASLAFRHRCSPMLAIFLVLAFACIGVLPFASVLNRPDQGIRIALAVWLLLPLTIRAEGWTQPVLQGLLVALIIVVPAAILASWHMKSILFFPIAATALWCLAPSWTVRAAGTAVLAYVAFSAASYWIFRLACPNYPQLGAYFGQALDPALLWQSPLLFGKGVLADLSTVPRYWQDMDFQAAYISNWLPNIPQTKFISLVNTVIATGFAALLGIALAAASLVLWQAVLCKVDKRAALLLSALVAGIAVSATAVPKYFTDSPLMLTLIGLIAWIAIEGLRDRPFRLFCPAAIVAITAMWAMSQPAFFASFAPFITTTWAVPGYTSNQFISFNFRNYVETRRKILATAQLCGIDPAQHPRHVIIDDLTYPAMIDVYQPLQILWVGLSWPTTEQKQFRFLHSIRSAGLVAACHLLPPSFQLFARRNGTFCCLPHF